MKFFDELTKVPNAVLMKSNQVQSDIISAFDGIATDELVDFLPDELEQIFLNNAKYSDGYAITKHEASATAALYVGMLLVVDVIITALKNHGHTITDVDHYFLYDLATEDPVMQISFNCDDSPVSIDLADTMEHMNPYFIQSALTNGINAFLTSAPNSGVPWIINVNGHSFHPCLAKAVFGCIETYTAK